MKTPHYHLTQQNGRVVFLGEAKIKKIFSLTCMSRQIILVVGGVERDDNV